MALLKTCITFLMLFISIEAHTQERIALVIGNANYASSALVNSVNDAEDIASTLENLDFTVTLIKNTNQQKLELSISEFISSLNDDTVGLFYYSGHAVQYKGNNYLVPIGSVGKVDQASDLPKYTVSTNTVLGGLNQSQSNLNFVFLDACRDNPFKNLSKEITPGLAKTSVGTRSTSTNLTIGDMFITRGVSETYEQVKDTKGILVAYSTMPGDVASDGRGRNSPYTKSILKHISKTNSLVQIMLSDVQQDVEKETSGKQTPIFESAITGRFCFNETNNGCGKAVVNIHSSYLKGLKDIQKLTLPDGSSYEGQVVDGKPHGKGIQVHIGGFRYEGEWKDGVSHGKGSFYGPNEYHYEGDWKNDVFDGFGTIVNENGRYEGNFVDGLPNGKGVQTWKNGSRYEGEWKDGELHGQGKHTWPNGRSLEGIFKDGATSDTGFVIEKVPGNYKYEGYIKNRKPNGKGIKKWAKGDIYDGNWINGKKSGFGIYIWKDTGTRYEGEWLDGKPVNGIFSWKNGSRYEGEWKDGSMHGQGTFTSKNEKFSHTGGWKNGKKNGFGITTKANGTTIEAEFTNGIPHGNIKITQVNGFFFEYQMELSGDLIGLSDLYKDIKDDDIVASKIIDMIDGEVVIRAPRLGDYKGGFKDGRTTGYGQEQLKDGSSYVGEILNNMAHGQGVKVEADGNRYKGSWVNGIRHGYGIMDFPDGGRYIGNWSNNKPDGKGVGYFPYGGRYSGAWKANKYHGYGEEFFANGDLYKGNWLNDKKNGYGEVFFANGEHYKGNWLNDERDGQGIYTWPDGRRYEGEWKAGKYHGTGTSTTISGKRWKGAWSNGKKVDKQ